MYTRREFGRLAAGTAVAAAAVHTAKAAEFEFKLHHILSEKSPAHTRMIAPWVKTVEEASGGRVKIDIYPAMSLGGKPPELVQQVRDGIVDLIWTVNGYTPGLFPRTEVFELPTIYLNDPKAANLAMHDMFEDLKPDFRGVEVMWLHVHAGQAIMMVDKEVRKPEDFRGLKIRIPSRTGAWVIEALGAAPLATPVPDVPQALSTRVIDGTLLPWEINAALKLHNQIKYFIEGHDRTRLGTTTFQVSMNQGRWEGLPDDIRAIFKDASSRDWWGSVGEYWRAGDDFGIDLAVKAGRTHVTLTEEETAAFMTALEPVVQRWVQEVTGAGIDGQALVDRARALIAKNATA
ncbi:MAG TPA: TRAP transporter substrate-binding protein [Paracoccaceae bacterium]|nr:TRAP transporter substrate-binding protein [Paracoccaceae bacterium]